MATPNTYNVTLHLERIQHLFQAPELDPFDSRYNTKSGVEQILNELQPQQLMCQVATTILLPQSQISETVEPACREALQKYCQTRIHQLSNDMVSQRRQGIIALQTGLIFLAACLVLATFFAKLEFLPEFLRRLFSEGFVIAGWVGLWHPIDLLLYSWWPKWRDKHLYKRIRDMDLKIKAEI